MEKWLPIKEWIGIYEVSNLGNVRRVIGGKGTNAGRLLCPTRLDTGYDAVRLRHQGRTERPSVHSLVMRTFIGKRLKKIEINHIDGVRHNNQLSNLEYCTSSFNKLHSYAVLKRQKVSCKGTQNGRSKLSESQVNEIRSRYSNEKVTQQKLADEYGVNQTMIGFIIRRVSWPHLKDSIIS